MKQSPSIPHLVPHYHRGQLSLLQWLRKRVSHLVTSTSGWLIFLLAIVMLTGVVGNRLYNQPQLAIGTQSPETIVAPSDLTIKDEWKTTQKLESARSRLIPVLKIDQGKNQALLKELSAEVKTLSTLRKEAGAELFVPTDQLTESVQVYLRTCSSLQFAMIVGNLETPPRGITSQLRQAQRELFQLSQRLSKEEFEQLLNKIQMIRQQFQTAREERKITGIDAIAKAILLELSPSQWESAKQEIKHTAEQMLAQGIAPGLPQSSLNTAIELHLEEKMPDQSAYLAIEILKTVLEPNLVEDTIATERQVAEISSSISPVMLSVKAEEVIVEAGEEITREQFLLLDAFGLSQRGVNWKGLLICGGLVSSTVFAFWRVKIRVKRSLRKRDQLLLILISVSSPLLLMFGIHYSCLPAVGLLVSSFYGPTLALTQVGLVTGLEVYTLLSEQGVIVPWETLITGSIGGLLAAAVAGQLRSREELALLGGAIGLIQGAVYLLLSLILNSSGEMVWYAMLPSAVLYGLSGLAWSIIAFGVSPYLERLFDIVTPIRLAELSNPNRPLLQRLAIEAPGTFQHTLFVASLAEAAARELDCNVELVRAGTLYHDIGKMHDPLGFIENQMGGKNKHDEMNDPYESAKIIKKHVSEGLVMARRCGLPKAIRDFIPEHQGTLLISYFYFQAKQQGKETIVESDFRYDGPIPQSRETGIVMLADGCEAALRSLNDVSEEKALSMVNKIIRARWQDGQLQEAKLTRTELKKIAQVFVRVWQQSNHKRIAYPKAALVIDN